MSSSHSGETGARAGEETKGFVKGLFQAGEDLRNNINSYADHTLDPGHKTSGTSSVGTTGTAPTSTTTTGTSSLDTTSRTSDGIHPDAKRTGDTLAAGTEKAGQKIDQMMTKSDRPN